MITITPENINEILNDIPLSDFPVYIGGPVSKQSLHFIHTLGDAHIYLNHKEQVNEQLKRKVKILPTLKINNNVDSIFDYKYEDFSLEGYNPDDHIKAPISV